MQETQIITFETPQKLLLQGLWIGPKNPKVLYIFIHGLSSALFSQINLAQSLVSRDSAILTFNNRGSGTVTGIKKASNTKKGYTRETMGAAHEVFTDCVDDLEGAVSFAKKEGAGKIFLVGHSTGSQKSVYYLHKKKSSPVAGAILLAPMSDYAGVVKETPPKVLAKAVAYAKKLIAAGKPHELLPTSIWPQPCDAQRFISLYTPESAEEIFSYAVPTKKPTALLSVSKPLLVVLADQDEYADQPLPQIAEWFKTTLTKKDAQVSTVADSSHNFNGHDKILRSLILDWVRKLN